MMNVFYPPVEDLEEKDKEKQDKSLKESEENMMKKRETNPEFDDE